MLRICEFRENRLRKRRVYFMGVDENYVDRDSVVGLVTRYELVGPGIESRWGREFPHPSAPTLGLT